MMRSNKQLLIENTLWVYFAKITVQVIALIASILVLRKLSVDVYGTYVFLLGLFSFYQLLITSPLRHVLLRFVPELRNKASLKVIIRLIALYIFTAVVLVFTLILITLACKDYIAKFFNVHYFDYYLIAFFVFVVVYALKILMEIVLSSLLMHRNMALLNVVVVVVRATLYFVLLKNLNVNILLWIESGVSLVYLFIAGVNLTYILKNENNTQDVAIDKSIVKRMNKFWLYSLFTEFGAGIIGRTSDYYIVAALSNPYYIGLYGFSLKIYELFYKLLPMREFESVLKPVFFTKYSTKTDSRELNRFYNYSIKALLPVFIFPFLYFLLFGRSLITHVFGDKFIEAYWTTVIVLFSLVINGAFYSLVLLIQLKEKLDVILHSRLVVFISLAAGIIMMNKYGIIGVAIATLIGELIKQIVMFLLFRKYCLLKYDLSIFYSFSAILIITVLLFMPFQQYFNQIVYWIIGSIVFVVFYVVLLINMHPFTKSEFIWFESALRSNGKIEKVYDKLKLLMRKFILVN